MDETAQETRDASPKSVAATPLDDSLRYPSALRRPSVMRKRGGIRIEGPAMRRREAIQIVMEDPAQETAEATEATEPARPVTASAAVPITLPAAAPPTSASASTKASAWPRKPSTPGPTSGRGMHKSATFPGLRRQVPRDPLGVPRVDMTPSPATKALPGSNVRLTPIGKTCESPPLVCSLDHRRPLTLLAARSALLRTSCLRVSLCVFVSTSVTPWRRRRPVLREQRRKRHRKEGAKGERRRAGEAPK